MQSSSSTDVATTTRPRLTKGVNCLSFDCGLTNLAYCFLEDLFDSNRVIPPLPGEKEVRIIKWTVFSLHAENIKQAAESCVMELNRRPWVCDVDFVVIESQVLKNTQMKCLSHIIQTYFLARGSTVITYNKSSGAMIQPSPRGPSVHFIEAKSKFNVCKVPEPAIKNRRVRNKRVAILMAQKILGDQGDVTTLKFLNSFEKKDDLSDSFLQGLYFLRLLRNHGKNAAKIKEHLGLPKEVKENEGIVIDISLDLNEGCEIDDEIPLPKTYPRETYSDPIYNIMDVSSSECYKHTISHKV